MVGLINHTQEYILAHDAGSHHDIAFGFVTMVLGDGLDPVLTVEFDHITIDELLIGAIAFLVHHRDIRLGFFMFIQEFVEIKGEDHIGIGDQHIILVFPFDPDLVIVQRGHIREVIGHG